MLDMIVFYIWVAALLFVIIYAALQKKPFVAPSLSVVQVRSDSMADVLTYRVSAPAPVSGDVVTRLLTVSVNGAEGETNSFPGTATEFATFSVPQNAEVVVTLVDVDDAGNKSEASTYSFVAVDTIPPAAPGAIGVTLVGETHVAPEAPVVPETPVVPEAPVVDEAVEEPTVDETVVEETDVENGEV